MADIFISYAREDEERVRNLVGALEQQGWSVFWDHRIPAGSNWPDYIGKALNEARCVMVAWSKVSVTSDFVREEASEGKRLNRLVPVLLDKVEPPFGFRQINAADLTDWRPGRASPRFNQMLEDVKVALGINKPRPERRTRSKKSKLLRFVVVAAILIVAGIVVANLIQGSRPRYAPIYPPPASIPAHPGVVKPPTQGQVPPRLGSSITPQAPNQGVIVGPSRLSDPVRPGPEPSPPRRRVIERVGP